MKLPLAIAACIVPVAAIAQTASQPAPSVKHRLEVSMSLDSEAPAAKESRERPHADLKLRVRISDHAIDSDYFGVVTYDFSSADPVNNTSVKTIWEDAACHIDRGLPKISIVEIQGSLTASGKKFDVLAVPRRIGKHVPDDEIIGQRQPHGGERPRAPEEQLGISLRAQTKQSGVRATIDLIATRCGL